MKILFLLYYSHEIGGGHLKRCIALANELNKLHCKVYLTIMGQKELSLNIDHEHIVLDINKANEKVIKDIVKEYDIVICDIIYPKNKSLVESTKKYIQMLDKCRAKTIIIDSLGENSATNQYNEHKIDLFIKPYAVKERDFGKLNVLCGEEYCILDDNFNKVQSETQNTKNKPKILVTCGASDPSMLTTKIMKVLIKLKLKVKIKIISGPLFKKELVNEIKVLKRRLEQCEIVDSPLSLYKEILNSDICIGSNGLTKYEYAALRKPSILIPIDREHYEVNKDFSELGTAIHLKYPFVKNDIRIAVQEIYKSQKKRDYLIKNCEKKINNKGVEKIARSIVRLGNKE